MPRLVPIVLGLALWIFGLIDCAQTPTRRMPPGLAKPVWLAIIVLVPVVGAIAWLLVSRLAQSSAAPRRSRRSPGPTAPDDDPEFLANLDWQARKAHHEQLKREREAAAGTGGAGADDAGEQPRDGGVTGDGETPGSDEAPGSGASPSGGTPPQA